MKTTKVMIDVDSVKLKIRVQNEEVIFDVFEAIKHPYDKKILFWMDELDEVCLEFKKAIVANPLEKVLINQLKG